MKSKPILTQRAWRLANGWTQAALALEMGLKQQVIARWESINPEQRRRPDVEDIVLIEKITNGQVTAKSYTLDFMRQCPAYAAKV